MDIPAATTDITTINSEAVALSPGTIQLATPVHAHGIVVRRLHLLLLIHFKSLGGSELGIEDFVAGLAEGTERRLL